MARVLAEAFAVFEPLYTPGALAATTPSAEVIGERFSVGPMWVAEQQGAIVGTASAVAKGTGLYVRSVAVPPAARGQRVGRALVAAVEAYAVARGCQRMLLSTAPVLTRAGSTRVDGGVGAFN
jgi:GNAT superfamily N-acetyltransferase